MSTTDQRRAWVLNRLGRGELTTTEAAGLLGLSERQVWRIRGAFEARGPAGLVHGNRDRVSPRRTDPAVARRVVELALGRYAGCNDCHLTGGPRQASPRTRPDADTGRVRVPAGSGSPLAHDVIRQSGEEASTDRFIDQLI